MKLGTVISSALVSAASVALVASASTAAYSQEFNLRMQTHYAAETVSGKLAQGFIDNVEKMSGGRVKIDYLPSGAVVKAFQVQDACHKGVLDGAHTVTAYWYGKNKAASLFGTGPVFGCNASQILAWIHYGGGKELYNELVQKKLNLNLVGFFAMPMPTQPLGWFKKKVSNVGDMKGLKYRTVGLATDIMQGMGLKVTQLPGGEIMPALEKGVIEAFEFNNPTADSQFGAQDVSKHYHMGSYHQAAEFFEIIFNKRRFDGLPKEVQAILEYGAEAANTANYGYAMDLYSKDLQKLIKESNVNVYRTDKSIMQAQLKSWDTVLERLNKDPFFKKVVDSQRAWSERVAFYDLVNAADYKLAYDHYFPKKLPF